MTTFFGTLLRRISVSNKVQLIWLGAVVFVMIMLAILHHKWKGDAGKMRLWRVLCLIPLIIAAVHALLYLRGFPEFAGGYFPLYITAVFALLPIPFAGRKIGYKITAVIVGLVTCVFGFYYLGMAPHQFNHAKESYTEWTV